MTHTQATQTLVATELVPAADEELRGFYARTLADSDRVMALHQWRTEHDGNSGGLEIAAARYDGRIVGAMGAVPATLTFAGRRINAAFHIDTIVDPAMRRRGIARRLLDVAGADRELVVAKGTVDAMYRLRKASGYRDVSNSRYLIRVLASRPNGSHRLRRWLSPPLHWYLRMRGADHVGTPVQVQNVSHFDSDLDRLARRLSLTHELRPQKTGGYLNWRYTTCPNRSYTLLQAANVTGLTGAAVVRVPTEPWADAWLTDMILDNRDAATAHALLNHVFRLCHDHGCSAVRTFATSRVARSWLRTRGFVEISETPHFTYRVNTPIEPRVLDRVPWNFWHGDADNELHDR